MENQTKKSLLEDGKLLKRIIEQLQQFQSSPTEDHQAINLINELIILILEPEESKQQLSDSSIMKLIQRITQIGVYLQNKISEIEIDEDMISGEIEDIIKEIQNSREKSKSISLNKKIQELIFIKPLYCDSMLLQLVDLHLDLYQTLKDAKFTSVEDLYFEAQAILKAGSVQKSDQEISKLEACNKAQDLKIKISHYERIIKHLSPLNDQTEIESFFQLKQQEEQLKNDFDNLNMKGISDVNSNIQNLQNKIIEFQNSLDNYKQIKKQYENLEALFYVGGFTNTTPNNELFQTKKSGMSRKERDLHDSLVTAENNYRSAIQKPESFERSIDVLIYLSNLIQHSALDKITSISDLEKELEKEYVLIKSQIEEEDDYYHKYINLVEQAEKQQKDIKSSLKILQDIRHKTQNFNINQAINYLKQGEDSSMRVKDKNIILLLGSTGQGKSTTILYLAGEQMEYKLVDNLPHIDAKKPLQNPRLEKVVCSPYSRSETSCINSIELEDKLYICDTPGFFDTRSSEIDFTNSILISQSLQLAKTVRPIFFFSEKNMGCRGGLLKEQIELYSRLFQKADDILNHQNNLIFYFTQATNGNNEEIKRVIHARLVDLKQNLPDSSRNNDFLMNFLSVMISNPKNLFLIDPLENKHSEYFEFLKNTDPIQYPTEVFTFRANHQTHNQVSRQMTITQEVLLSYMPVSSSHSFIIFKLNQLEEFSRLSNLSFADHFHPLDSYILNQQTNLLDLLKKFLLLTLKMNEELSTLKDFQMQLATCNSLYEIRINLLKICPCDSKDSSRSKEQVEQIMLDILSSRVEEEIKADEELQNGTNVRIYVKMQKIEQVLPLVDNFKMVLRDTIKTKIEKLRQGFMIKFEGEKRKIEEGSKGLEECKDDLAKIKNAIKNMKKTDLGEESSKMWQNIVWEIQKSFSKVSANITNNICQDEKSVFIKQKQLNDQEFLQKITQSIETLNKMKEQFSQGEEWAQDGKEIVQFVDEEIKKIKTGIRSSFEVQLNKISNELKNGIYTTQYEIQQLQDWIVYFKQHSKFIQDLFKDNPFSFYQRQSQLNEVILVQLDAKYKVLNNLIINLNNDSQLKSLKENVDYFISFKWFYSQYHQETFVTRIYDALQNKLRHIFEQLKIESELINFQSSKEEINDLIYYDKIHTIIKKFREVIEIKEEERQYYEVEWDEKLIVLIEKIQRIIQEQQQKANSEILSTKELKELQSFSRFMSIICEMHSKFDQQLRTKLSFIRQLQVEIYKFFSDQLTYIKSQIDFHYEQLFTFVNRVQLDRSEFKQSLHNFKHECVLKLKYAIEQYRLVREYKDYQEQIQSLMEDTSDLIDSKISNIYELVDTNNPNAFSNRVESDNLCIFSTNIEIYSKLKYLEDLIPRYQKPHNEYSEFLDKRNRLIEKITKEICEKIDIYSPEVFEALQHQFISIDDTMNEIQQLNQKLNDIEWMKSLEITPHTTERALRNVEFAINKSIRVLTQQIRRFSWIDDNLTKQSENLKRLSIQIVYLQAIITQFDEKYYIKMQITEANQCIEKIRSQINFSKKNKIELLKLHIEKNRFAQAFCLFEELCSIERSVYYLQTSDEQQIQQSDKESINKLKIDLKEKMHGLAVQIEGSNIQSVEKLNLKGLLDQLSKIASQDITLRSCQNQIEDAIFRKYQSQIEQFNRDIQKLKREATPENLAEDKNIIKEISIFEYSLNFLPIKLMEEFQSQINEIKKKIMKIIEDARESQQEAENIKLRGKEQIINPEDKAQVIVLNEKFQSLCKSVIEGLKTQPIQTFNDHFKELAFYLGIKQTSEQLNQESQTFIEQIKVIANDVLSQMIEIIEKFFDQTQDTDQILQKQIADNLNLLECIINNKETQVAEVLVLMNLAGVYEKISNLIEKAVKCLIEQELEVNQIEFDNDFSHLLSILSKTRKTERLFNEIRTEAAETFITLQENMESVRYFLEHLRKESAYSQILNRIRTMIQDGFSLITETFTSLKQNNFYEKLDIEDLIMVLSQCENYLLNLRNSLNQKILNEELKQYNIDVKQIESECSTFLKEALAYLQKIMKQTMNKINTKYDNLNDRDLNSKSKFMNIYETIQNIGKIMTTVLTPLQQQDIENFCENIRCDLNTMVDLSEKRIMSQQASSDDIIEELRNLEKLKLNTRPFLDKQIRIMLNKFVKGSKDKMRQILKDLERKKSPKKKNKKKNKNHQKTIMDALLQDLAPILRDNNIEVNTQQLMRRMETNQFEQALDAETQTD